MRYGVPTFFFALVSTACFSPKRAENLNCSTEGQCPSGQICGADNSCYSDDLADAAGMVDAGEIDAAGCPWDLGFSIANIGICGPQGEAEIAAESTVSLAELGTYFLDTTTGEFLSPAGEDVDYDFTFVAQVDGPELFVIPTQEFFLSVGSSLLVSGSRALVIVAVGDVVIEGILDASGKGAIDGPGGNQNCQASGTGESGTGHLGGGGGGLGSDGGDGGLGRDFLIPAAGAVAQLSELIPLRGGCAGGVGGEAATGVPGGSGGGSGGAIQLVSGTQIEVTGSIAVGGGGGQGGTSNVFTGSGGGGGGSGGGVLLQSVVVQFENGKLIGSGGGGGGGGGAGVGANGASGADGNRLTGGLGGVGGRVDKDTNKGGDGGNGATIVSPAGNGSNGQKTESGTLHAAGGGGGGGVGLIVVDVID